MRKKIILLLMIFCLSFFAYAQMPHLINYQGRLTNNEGAPLDGIYEVTFRIYDMETNGAPLWMEKHAGVDIEKGILSVMLGAVTDLDLAFDKPYFLEIKVNDEVMAPRQRITSVGYALRAETAEKAIVAVVADNTETIKGKAVDTPSAGDDGKMLQYDHDNSKFKLASSMSVKTGTYLGSGSSLQTITHNLGRAPSLILIMADGKSPNSHGIWISGNSHIVLFNTSNSFPTTVTDNTFTVTADGGGDFNERGRTYRYIVM